MNYPIRLKSKLKQNFTICTPLPTATNCLCRYELYGIIMHLGSTMASGHYVSYVSGRDTVIDSADCQRDKRKTASLSGGAVKPTSNTEKQKNLFRSVMSY